MGDHFGKISACYCTLLPFNLLEVPKYFGLVHIFCHAKHLLKYSASHKHLMPDKRRICSQENWFLCWQKSFWRGTKCSQILWLAQKFGPAQNVLGPVKGQGIRLLQGPKYPVLPTLSYIPRKSSLAFEAACLEPSFSICYKSLKVLINFEFALLRWSEWGFFGGFQSFSATFCHSN